MEKFMKEYGWLNIRELLKGGLISITRDIFDRIIPLNINTFKT